MEKKIATCFCFSYF